MSRLLAALGRTLGGLFDLRSYRLQPRVLRDPALAEEIFGPSEPGYAVDEWTATNCSAVWAAVRIISESLAGLPLILYRRDGEGKRRAPEHPLYRVLHDNPNEEDTSFTVREILQAHALVWGNAYAEIERDRGGRVAALWPLTPDMVTPFRRGSDDAIVYRVGVGETAELPAENVLHIKGLGYYSLKGYSVIQVARESLQLVANAEAYGRAYYENGARPGGTLEYPGKLTKEARKNIVEGWERRHQGSAAAARVALLEEGLKYNALPISNEDAQFLQLREFSIEEVARWFNIPPHLLRDLRRATFSNIEHQGIDYVTYTLLPWARRWEQEINKKLLGEDEREDYFAEFLFDSLLRGDAPTRTQALATQFLNGALTLDEWRTIENRNPLPDGQGAKHFVPLNLQPIEAALAPPPVEPAPALPEPAEPEPAVDEEQILKLREALALARRQQDENTRRLSRELAEARRAHLADCAGRICRRLGQAARRAAQSPGQFLAKAEAQAREQLPVAREIAGRRWQDVGGLLVEEWRASLVELAGTVNAAGLAGAVEEWCQNWERERPARLAGEVVREQP